MQAHSGRGATRGGGLGGSGGGTQFVQLHAAFEQRMAVARIAREHRRLVVGGERIGQHLHRDAARRERHEILRATVAGDEVRRNQQQLLLRAIGERLDVRADAQLRLVVPGLDLFRLVGDQGGRSPEPLARTIGGGAVGQLVQRRLRIIRLGEHARVVRQVHAQPGQVVMAGMLAAEGLHRVGGVAVPVLVEGLRRLLHHRADRDQVEVAEIGVAGIEIGVADIAAADDGDVAVHDERLVVHAPVEPVRIQQELGGPGEQGRFLRGERVEQPHLDVRMGIQRVEHVDRPSGVDVVHQQAHAHAAIRRRQQPLRHQPASRVVVEDVVLQVERMLRVVGQRHPAHQCVGAAREQTEAGLVLVLFHFGVDVARARRGRGRRQRLRRRLDHRRRRRAGTQRQAQHRQCNCPHETPHARTACLL